MFYSPQAVDTLTKRIGWAPIVPPYPASVSTANAESTSGRTVAAFHRLATAENVLAHIPNWRAGESDTALQASLADLRAQAVRKVLAAVFDNNVNARYRTDRAGNRTDISGKDYSEFIATHSSAFDDAIGYQIAADTIEYLIASPRINPVERASELSMLELRLELDGVRDETGNVLSKGVYRLLGAALGKLQALFFPALDNTPRVRDISHMW